MRHAVMSVVSVAVAVSCSAVLAGASSPSSWASNILRRASNTAAATEVKLKQLNYTVQTPCCDGNNDVNFSDKLLVAFELNTKKFIKDDMGNKYGDFNKGGFTALNMYLSKVTYRDGDPIRLRNRRLADRAGAKCYVTMHFDGSAEFDGSPPTASSLWQDHEWTIFWNRESLTSSIQNAALKTEVELGSSARVTRYCPKGGGEYSMADIEIFLYKQEDLSHFSFRSVNVDARGSSQSGNGWDSRAGGSQNSAIDGSFPSVGTSANGVPAGAQSNGSGHGGRGGFRTPAILGGCAAFLAIVVGAASLFVKKHLDGDERRINRRNHQLKRLPGQPDQFDNHHDDDENETGLPLDLMAVDFGGPSTKKSRRNLQGSTTSSSQRQERSTRQMERSDRRLKPKPPKPTRRMSSEEFEVEMQKSVRTKRSQSHLSSSNSSRPSTPRNSPRSSTPTKMRSSTPSNSSRPTSPVPSSSSQARGGTPTSPKSSRRIQEGQRDSNKQSARTNAAAAAVPSSAASAVSSSKDSVKSGPIGWLLKVSRWGDGLPPPPRDGDSVAAESAVSSLGFSLDDRKAMVAVVAKSRSDKNSSNVSQKSGKTSKSKGNSPALREPIPQHPPPKGTLGHYLSRAMLEDSAAERAATVPQPMTVAGASYHTGGEKTKQSLDTDGDVMSEFSLFGEAILRSHRDSSFCDSSLVQSTTSTDSGVFTGTGTGRELGDVPEGEEDSRRTSDSNLSELVGDSILSRKSFMESSVSDLREESSDSEEEENSPASIVDSFEEEDEELCYAAAARARISEEQFAANNRRTQTSLHDYISRSHHSRSMQHLQPNTKSMHRTRSGGWTSERGDGEDDGDFHLDFHRSDPFKVSGTMHVLASYEERRQASILSRTDVSRAESFKTANDGRSMKDGAMPRRERESMRSLATPSTVPSTSPSSHQLSPGSHSTRKTVTSASSPGSGRLQVDWDGGSGWSSESDSFGEFQDRRSPYSASSKDVELQAAATTRGVRSFDRRR